MFPSRGLQHPFIPSMPRSSRVLVNSSRWNMADSKASKVWEAYSKMDKMKEEDWPVLEALYNEYRYRQGDLQRTEFIKRLVAKGVTSYLYQLKSRTPEALLKIDQDSTTLGIQGYR